MANKYNIKKKWLYIWDIKGNSYGEYEYISDISKKLHTSNKKIILNLEQPSNLINNKFFISTSANFYLPKSIKLFLEQNRKDNLFDDEKNKIRITSQTGNFWEFNSIYSAAKKIGITENTVSSLLENKEKIEFKGYLFEKLLI